jgi:GWxTD domain-containing protein
MLGRDALSRSAMAFAKSAEVDPSFTHGLVELAGTALRQRVNIRLDVALDALRRAGATRAAEHPEVLLARGRVEREVGDADSALVAFRRYLETGPNTALGHLELARTYFLLGSLDGVPHYYEGAATDDSATIAAYRSDLALIAPDSTLAGFDGTTGQGRVAFLRRFWTDRDHVALRGEGERVQEHYRRWFYARRNFALASTNRHYDIAERFRSGSRDFDDRGVVYLRHGEPTRRASMPATGGIEPNESWLYERKDGDLLFHFVAREDVQDYKLVESALDVLGFSSTVWLSDADALSSNAAALQLLQSRDRLSPIYGRIQSAGSVTAGRFQNEERQMGRRSIAAGTRSDSYELNFPRELEARSEVLAVGQEAGAPQVQITYAIAGASLVPVSTARGPMYPVRLRFVAYDAAGRVVASLDTTRRFLAAAEVPDGEHLVGRVSLAVPGGVYTYRLALQQGEDTGVVLPRDTVRVAAARTGTLALSDVVLGSRRINLLWHPASGDTVYFNPLRTFRRGDVMQMYYELHGLEPGVGHTTEIVVKKGSEPLGSPKKLLGGGKALNLKFEDQAQGQSSSVLRSIAIDRLKPGRYVLGIVITDGRKRVAWRETEFAVVDE